MMRFYIYSFLILLISYTTLSLEPKILWWFDTDDSAFGQSAMDDIDGDNYYEIVFGCYRNDSMVYALNAVDGTLLWKYNTTVYQEGCNDTAPIIFDITNDGKKEVIVPSSCNPYTYCFDGATGEVIWQTQTRGSDSPPTIADLDNDAQYEILHGQFGGYVICINGNDGSVKWEIEVDTNSWIQTAPSVADLNNNGQLDFIVATWHFDDGNKIYAYDGSDQSLLWSTELNDVVYHGSAIVDLNFDGEKEIIIGDYSGRLYAIAGSTGDILWTYDAAGYIGSPVSVADITGNGQYEIIFCAGYSIVALNIIGELLWQYNIPDYKTAFRGVALSDIDNDAIPDVIFGTSGGKLIALNGFEGDELWSVDLAEHIGKEFDINHAPIIGDFTGNGLLDVFIVGGYTEMPDFGNNYGRAYAIEIGEGKGPEWKMFQNNIRRTGTIEINNTSVKYYDSNTNLNIYPNPLTAGERIRIEAYDCMFTGIEITDILGRIVFNDGFKNSIEIDMNFPEGLYYVKLFNGKDMTASKIFIKSR